MQINYVNIAKELDRPYRKTGMEVGHLELDSEIRQSVGRPLMRWIDDIRQIAGKNWCQKAQE